MACRVLAGIPNSGAKLSRSLAERPASHSGRQNWRNRPWGSSRPNSCLCRTPSICPSFGVSTSIRFILQLGLHDLFIHRRLALIMSLSIAIATAMVAFLVTYRAGLAAEFVEQTPGMLVVHDLQNVGDISGSRISSRVAGTLSGLGISMIIPEIRAVTGTSVQNATLLRGIDLEQYTRLESFTMLSGRRLEPGDPSRLAMVGALLAERLGLEAGDRISLRAMEIAPGQIRHAFPILFRHLSIDDQLVQVRAVPLEQMSASLGLTLVGGTGRMAPGRSWPAKGRPGWVPGRSAPS